MATIQNFVDDTLVLIGIVDAGGTPASSERTHALNALNRLLGLYSATGLLIPSVVVETFSLSGAASYSLGPGATMDTARPLKLRAAAVRVGSVHKPLEIVTAEQWAQIRDKARAGKWADYLYWTGGYPTGTIYLTPTPASGGYLELHSLKALATVALADPISWPEGYEHALQFALASAIAVSYGRPVPPDVAAQAKYAQDALVALNQSVLGVPMPVAAPLQAPQQ